MKLPTIDEIIEFTRLQLMSAKPTDANLAAAALVRKRLQSYVDGCGAVALVRVARAVGMPAEDVDVEHLALELLEAVERLPELAAPARPLPAFPVEEDGYVPRYPHLTHAVRAGSTLLLVGGVPVAPKLAWVREVIGGGVLGVDWIATEDDPDSKGCTRVANMIKGRKAAAVVFFQSFMSHLQTQMLMGAGREADVPVLPGDKAGQGSLTAAFEQIDKLLAQRRAA
jgi:hypothetical protein